MQWTQLCEVRLDPRYCRGVSAECFARIDWRSARLLSFYACGEEKRRGIDEKQVDAGMRKAGGSFGSEWVDSRKEGREEEEELGDVEGITENVNGK